MRKLTRAAMAAKAIREDLKKAFPKITFRVRSNNYSMGDSVYIDWENGPTTKSVDDLVMKYQYGSFDGMRDIYEYTNSRDDIPQTKYVMTQRSLSDERRAELRKAVAEEWGLEGSETDREIQDRTGYWLDQLINRKASETSFPASA